MDHRPSNSHPDRTTMNLSLKYSGPDVDDGAMAAADVGRVIEGFLTAYIKVVKADGGELPRLKGISLGKGSSKLFFEILGDAMDTLTHAKTLFRIIDLYKWSKGKLLQPGKLDTGDGKSIELAGGSRSEVRTGGRIEVKNCEDETESISVGDYEKYKEGMIRPELKKISSPLAEGRIDSWEARAETSAGEIIATRVSSEERGVFEKETQTTTKETRIRGKINRVTKSTRTGSVILSDGSSVPFKFVGDDVSSLYTAFPHDGPVKLDCVAHLDENLKVTKLEVSSVDVIQLPLDFGG